MPCVYSTFLIWKHNVSILSTFFFFEPFLPSPPLPFFCPILVLSHSTRVHSSINHAQQERQTPSDPPLPCLLLTQSSDQFVEVKKKPHQPTKIDRLSFLPTSLSSPYLPPPTNQFTDFISAISFHASDSRFDFYLYFHASLSCDLIISRVSLHIVPVCVYAGLTQLCFFWVGDNLFTPSSSLLHFHLALKTTEKKTNIHQQPSFFVTCVLFHYLSSTLPNCCGNALRFVSVHSLIPPSPFLSSLTSTGTSFIQTFIGRMLSTPSE